jgi:DNA-binding transcriptional ArsR family regulator
LDPSPDPTRSTASLRATAHPLRLRMLSLLTGATLSAAEVARELGITQANASYHLRVLAKAGLVAEGGEERVRGGVAKRYRHPWDDYRSEPASPAAYQGYLQGLASELTRRGLEQDTASPGTTADAELWVAPDVRDRVAELLGEAAHLLHAQARPPRTPGAVRVSLTMALFEMTGDDNDQAKHRS